jgi:transcriptional antiterminator NusG
MAEQDQEGQWFVVQTLSGQEFKVCESLLRRRKPEGVEHLVLDVQVPMEKVSDTRRGKKTVQSRKFFPGYILVRARLFDEQKKLITEPWYFIRETQGVIGLIGGEKPVALTVQEVENVLMQTQKGEEVPKPKISFAVGETVTIKDGAFENFEGTVEAVDQDRGKLRLSVTIFGRSTPVEVEYWQVERG